LLSNKKASFNPNQPGYYRYYSSSHPDPEHQGPRIFDTNEQGQLTLSEGARLDSTEINMVQNAHGQDPHDNEVSFGRGTISRGIYTRTNYYEEAQAVPTKDILFLSFQEHGIKYLHKGVRPKVTGKVKGVTLLSTISSLILRNILNKRIKANFTGAQANKAVFKRKAKYGATFKTVSKVVKKEEAIVGDDEKIDATLLPEVINQTLDLINSTLASDWSEAGYGKDEVMDANNVKKIILDINARFGLRVTIRGAVSWENYSEYRYQDSWKSPIFPVSDENGYELFGAYQYGRGLDIVPTNTFDILLRADPSRLLDEDDMDVFLKGLHDDANRLRGTDRAGLFASTTTSIVDRLVSYDREHGTDKVGDAYYRLKGSQVGAQQNKAESLKSLLTNSLMTSRNDQVAGNVPIRISDIRPSTRGDAACDCRGDTSDVEIYLADEGNLLQILQPNDLDDSHIVQSFKKEISDKVPDWVDRQKKMMGDDGILYDLAEKVKKG